ncbi:MAG TPA: cellulose biosynthesis protein BcsN [Microvirga sp.]|nr:cellulose biosynthesis protein BcsN [Microvirga sp.]
MASHVAAACKFAVAALLGSTVLAACASRPLDMRVQTLTSEVPVTQAIVLPPPGGPSIVTLLERRRSNAIEQELILSTNGSAPGQNAFYVSLFEAVGAPTAGDATDVAKLPSVAREAIAAEMEDRLPNVAMQVSPYFVQNKYGPFGYAAGLSDTGDTCLYAWQTIEPNERELFSLQSAILATAQGAISVRLRICEPGAPEEALLRLMYEFSVVAHLRSPGWNPYGDPPPADPRIGQTGAPVYPISRNGHTQPVAEPARPAVQPAPRQVLRRVAPAPREDLALEDPASLSTRPTPAPRNAPPLRTVPRRGPLEGYPTIPPPP